MTTAVEIPLTILDFANIIGNDLSLEEINYYMGQVFPETKIPTLKLIHRGGVNQQIEFIKSEKKEGLPTMGSLLLFSANRDLFDIDVYRPNPNKNIWLNVNQQVVSQYHPKITETLAEAEKEKVTLIMAHAGDLTKTATPGSKNKELKKLIGTETRFRCGSYDKSSGTYTFLGFLRLYKWEEVEVDLSQNRGTIKVEVFYWVM